MEEPHVASPTQGRRTSWSERVWDLLSPLWFALPVLVGISIPRLRTYFHAHYGFTERDFLIALGLFIVTYLGIGFTVLPRRKRHKPE